MPEWYFVLLVLAGVVLLGLSWPPLFWLAPLFVLGIGLTAVQAAQGARKASFHPEPPSKLGRLRLQLIVAWFHLVQPAARLLGRMQHGLGPWHWRRLTRAIPVQRIRSFWSEEWQANEARLADIENYVDRLGAAVRRGGDFDGWDLEIQGGLFGSVRMVAMVEEHGSGRQLFRLRVWPRVPLFVFAMFAALSVLAGLAAIEDATVAALSLALGAGFTAFMAYSDCAVAMRNWQKAVELYVGGRPTLTPMR